MILSDLELPYKCQTFVLQNHFGQHMTTMSAQKKSPPYDLRVETLLRYGTLILVVLQTTATVLLLRYSRTREGTPYLASTAVFLSEIFKFVVCLGSLLTQNGFSVKVSYRMFIDEIVKKPRETFKLLVPSGLYTIQNNLLFTALTNLDAATYQVTYQLKILTTAVFSVFLLHKQVHRFQWLALLLLTIGVALVQFPNRTPAVVDPNEVVDEAAILKKAEEAETKYHKQLVGLAAVICACFSSGFAGAYFEKLVKQGVQTSVVIRNIQLGLFSLVFGFVAVIYNDLDAILEKGFFQGYTPVVWIIIFFQAFGGLVVALTVKYADSILKGFATSISIILSSLLSFLLLDDLKLGSLFIVGTNLVILATFMYGSSSLFKSKDDSK